MIETNANEHSGIVPFSSNTVELSETSLAWAADMSRTVLDEEAQWQVFLRAIAVVGFEQWLAEGGSAFETWLPTNASSLNAFANFRANGHQLCVLTATGSAETVEIVLNPAASGLSRLAHFYVLVEVREEIDQVCILAGLRRDQLLPTVSSSTVSSPTVSSPTVSFQMAEDSTSIEVSQSLFNLEPEQILLYMSCLEPDALLESTPWNRPVEALSAGVVNARLWLQGQLDQLSEQLDWVLLPPPRIASAMRLTERSLEAVTTALADNGIQLPAAARGISGVVSVDWFVGALYAWVWPVETGSELEWSLLLVLGSQTEALPEGIQLWVSDNTGVIVRERLAQSAATYLYTQVQGMPSEKFWVRIVLPDGKDKVLPAFCFEDAL